MESVSNSVESIMTGPTIGDIVSLTFLAHTILKNDQSWRDMAPLLRLILIGQNMLSLDEIAHDILWPMHFVGMKIEDVMFQGRADRSAEPGTTTLPTEIKAVAVEPDRWSALRSGKHDTMAEECGDFLSPSAWGTRAAIILVKAEWLSSDATWTYTTAFLTSTLWNGR